MYCECDLWEGLKGFYVFFCKKNNYFTMPDSKPAPNTSDQIKIAKITKNNDGYNKKEHFLLMQLPYGGNIEISTCSRTHILSTL